jgi:hypothetical protein
VVVRCIATLMAAVVLVAAGSEDIAAAATATQDDSSQSDAAQELADRYAPVVMLSGSEQACDSEREQFRPTSVDVMLDNPEIALRQVSNEDPVVMRGPSAQDLFELGDGFYLDAPGGPLRPGCTYESDFEKYSADQADVVYAHVVQQDDVPDRVYVQYWLYWYFNDWNNKHEGDWEGIVLEFDATSPEDALDTEPIAIGYSQHEGGERAAWGDDKLELLGTSPVVYPSAGSHASYFGSAVYLGRGPSEGFGCDSTIGPHQRSDPEVVLLPTEVTDPDDPLAWLAFDGRWGEREAGPFNGPTGPTDKDRWLRPADWFGELRESSVLIPAGDSDVGALVEIFCGVVEGGSSLLILAAISPGLLILGLLLVVAVVMFLVGRTDWSPVPPRPLVQHRRAGQILGGAARLYRSQPLAFAASGLVYIPAALITGLIVGLIELIPGVAAFMNLASESGGTGIVLALLVGSLANLLAFSIVNAVVADHLGRERHGFHGIIEAVSATWTRRGALAGAMGRSIAVVFLLLVSVIGIPFGIWKLIHYQFVAQAVALDGATGRGALERSTSLVKRRWFHVALMTVIVNGLVVAAAVVVSLLLLILATGVPLWAFAGIEAVVFALTVPLAAISMTLLYGSAVAASAEDPELVDA